MKQKRSLWQSVAGFFKDTSPFMIKVERIALLAELNLCLLLCSLPAITAGAALTALHATLLQFSTLTYGSAFKAFFRAFWQAVRSTFLLWLLTLVAAGALGAGWYTVLVSQLTDNFSVMLPLLLSSAVVLFTAVWLYPLAAAQLYNGTIRRAKELLSDAFLLGLKELPRSFGGLLLTLAPAALLLWACAVSVTAVGVWVLFGISPFALCHSFLVKSIIFPEEK